MNRWAIFVRPLRDFNGEKFYFDKVITELYIVFDRLTMSRSVMSQAEEVPARRGGARGLISVRWLKHSEESGGAIQSGYYESYDNNDNFTNYLPKWQIDQWSLYSHLLSLMFGYVRICSLISEKVSGSPCGEHTAYKIDGVGRGDFE